MPPTPLRAKDPAAFLLSPRDRIATKRTRNRVAIFGWLTRARAVVEQMLRHFGLLEPEHCEHPSPFLHLRALLIAPTGLGLPPPALRRCGDSAKAFAPNAVTQMD